MFNRTKFLNRIYFVHNYLFRKLEKDLKLFINIDGDIQFLKVVALVAVSCLTHTKCINILIDRTICDVITSLPDFPPISLVTVLILNAPAMHVP